MEVPVGWVGASWAVRRRLRLGGQHVHWPAGAFSVLPAERQVMGVGTAEGWDYTFGTDARGAIVKSAFVGASG